MIQKQYSSGRPAILEISSSGVKLTQGVLGPFRENSWRCYKTRTKTREGLHGGLMDLEFWKSRVVPVITKYIEILGTTDIPCVATEWARECKNLGELRRLMPRGLELRVLSKQEESAGTLEAYKATTCRRLRDYDDIVIIDPGSMSTEVRSIHGNPWCSVRNLDPRAAQTIRGKFRYLSKLPRVLLVCTENLWNPVTGEPGKWNLHDRIWPESEILKRPDIRWIWEALGCRPMVLSGGTLGIGLLTSGMEKLDGTTLLIISKMLETMQRV